MGHEQRSPISEAIYETHIQNLDLLPSHIRLALIERMVQIEEQYRLKDCLEEPTAYEFIIIDCAPNLGVSLTQALLASSHVLVPVAAQYYPHEGVVDLTQTIQATPRTNSYLAVLGYLLTSFDVRNKICAEVMAKLQEVFGDEVFETVIRSNVALQYAPALSRIEMSCAASGKVP